MGSLGPGFQFMCCHVSVIEPLSRMITNVYMLVAYKGRNRLHGSNDQLRDHHFIWEIRIKVVLFPFAYTEFSSATLTLSCSVLEGSVILRGHTFYLE